MGVIKKQGILNTVIVYVGILIGVVGLLYVQPHFLKTEEIGLIKIMLSFGSLFAAIFPIGAPNIAVKYLPKFYSPENRHHGFFGIMMFFPAVGIIVGSISLYFLKDWIVSIYSLKSPLFAGYFYFVIPLSVFITVIFTLNAYSNAILKTVFPSFLNDVVNRLLLIVIILLYFFSILNLDQFLISFICIYGLQATLVFIYLFFVGNISIKPDIKYLNEKVGFKFILRYGLILSVTSVAGVSIKFLDSIFLGKENLSWVGIYSIPAFIGLIIETPLNSLERIANSKIAHHLAENNFIEIKKIYFTSSRYLMLIGGLLASLVVISINDLLLMLPEPFHGAGVVTMIIAVASFINMATGVNYPILINSTKYIWGSVFLLILLVMAFMANYYLVPKYGMMGAAIATAGSTTFYNLLKYLFIWKNFKMQPFDKMSLLILLITGLTVSIGFFIPSLENHLLSIFMRSVVCGSFFLLVTYLCKIVPEYHKFIPFIGKK